MANTPKVTAKRNRTTTTKTTSARSTGVRKRGQTPDQFRQAFAKASAVNAGKRSKQFAGRTSADLLPELMATASKLPVMPKAVWERKNDETLVEHANRKREWLVANGHKAVHAYAYADRRAPMPVQGDSTNAWRPAHALLSRIKAFAGAGVAQGFATLTAQTAPTQLALAIADSPNADLVYFFRTTQA
jgi:hypothetical protein